MDYYEITKAIRMKLEYVPAAAGQKDVNNITFSSDNFNSDFEDIICCYVDAINEVKRVRNRNKQWCLLYDSIGFEQWQIGEILHISQPAVWKNIKWLKRFFSQEVIKTCQV